MNKKNKKIARAGFVLLMVALISFPSQTIQAQVKKEKINKGAVKSRQPAAKVNRPSASNVNRPSTSNRSRPTAKRNPGRNTNINSGNKTVNINVDKSKDIRINNSRNTTVRRGNNFRPYSRPPYRYGRHRYYCHNPYRYHPYRPFYWGPRWHPWGFFIRTMAATAIIISIENQQYYYDEGVYYMAGNGGYTVVQAPVGATIVTLPEGAKSVDNSNNSTNNSNNTTVNNYYYGGTYYEKSDNGYKVVPPTAGTIIENLPEGGEEVKMGEQTYVKIGETYYQPIEVNGKSMYEVVDVEDDNN